MSSTQEVGDIFGSSAGPAHAMLRSPTVLIASIGLWGMNIYLFKLFGIDFNKVLHHDLRKLDESNNEDEEQSIMELESNPYLEDVTAGQLVCLSATLLAMLHTTYVVWIDWMGGGTLGAVFAFYGAVLTAIVFPLKSTVWLRHAALLVLHRAYELIKPRCCNTPIRMIPFMDVFFADAMCSLSKVFFDWGMLIHLAFYYPNPIPSSALLIIIPSLAASIPYWIRARQCWVMISYSQSRDLPWTPHLMNATKYSTSIFPLVMSAYQKTNPHLAQRLEGWLILLLVLNASYALWWDVVMDWGMMKNPTAVASRWCGSPSSNGSSANYAMVPTRENGETKFSRSTAPIVRTPSSSTAFPSVSCWYVVLRNRLRFGVTISVVILVTDVVLRFSWVLRFFDSLFPSNDSFILCTQFLEVLRRALWNLLRVEWENIKHTPRTSPAVHVTVPHSPVVAHDIELKLRPTNGAKITLEKNAEA